ncbi:hypothetical protein [Companilactobacillus metriopterae]|uniref:hypothetical protein n=1 Tax=Companilactobacillus metriopterae TaxID=1909267 RepID=UPI00100B4849|nr:hypothetical protein [Companilactobacillus metriopterae]
MKKTILASTLAATVLISTPILTTVAQADVAKDAISSVTTSTKNTDTTPTQDTANTEPATTNESGTDTAVTESLTSGFDTIIDKIKDQLGLGDKDSEEYTLAMAIDGSLVNQYNLTSVPAISGLKTDDKGDATMTAQTFYKTSVGKLQTAPSTGSTSSSNALLDLINSILKGDDLDKINMKIHLTDLKDNPLSSSAKAADYKKGYKMSITYSVNKSGGEELFTRDEDLVYSPSSQIDTDDNESLNARFTSPYSVAAGTTNASLQGIATDLYIADDNGNTVSNVTNTTGKLYTTEKAAYNGTSSKEVTSSTLDTVGTTYYQTINVTSTSQAMINLMTKVSDGDEDYALMVNGSEADADNLNINLKSKSVTFRLVRAVTVAAPSTAWNTTSISGTVTTGSNATYTLVNDNGAAVANRALSGNSSWRTDTVRTNAAGQKQYRVATNEWIDASSVTFSDGSSTSGSAITSITDLSGSHVVDLATPGFVYALYKTDGGASTRYVAGGTSWVTDKTGKDAAGNTYYRVSTNEWVMAGNGVTFK